MIKNIIAALAVLPFLPSVAVAVEANLAKTPTSTLTYTIRAKDTSPTDILSMGGASSCSVTAQLASGSVSVVPRADASVAHSTGTAGTVTLSASGTGTLTSAAGQFSVSFTAVGKSTVTVTCTPGGSGGAAYDDTAIQAEVDANTTNIAALPDGSYDNTTSGLAATTLQGALDELEATKASSASQTSVLLQGQNGIANVSDPNDVTASPDVVCGTSTPGSCLFISDKGIEFVNTSLTKWRAVAAKHHNYIYELITTQAIGDALDGTKCLGNPFANWGDRVSACTNQKSEFRATTDITLDTLSLVVQDVAGGDQTIRSCAICISIDGGSTCAANSDVSLPSADGIAFTEGSTNSREVNIQIAKGSFFQLYAVTGAFSEAAGVEECAALGEQHIGVDLEYYER